MQDLQSNFLHNSEDSGRLSLRCSSVLYELCLNVISDSIQSLIVIRMWDPLLLAKVVAEIETKDTKY